MNTKEKLEQTVQILEFIIRNGFLGLSEIHFNESLNQEIREYMEREVGTLLIGTLYRAEVSRRVISTMLEQKDPIEDPTTEELILIVNVEEDMKLQLEKIHVVIPSTEIVLDTSNAKTILETLRALEAFLQEKLRICKLELERTKQYPSVVQDVYQNFLVKFVKDLEQNTTITTAAANAVEMELERGMSKEAIVTMEEYCEVIERVYSQTLNFHFKNAKGVVLC